MGTGRAYQPYYCEIMRAPDALGRAGAHGAKRTGFQRPACTGKVSAEGSRSRRPHAHSGRIVGAAAELEPAGGGAGADARAGGRTCCAKYRAPDSTERERVGQAQPDKVTASEEPQVLSDFYL